MWWRRWCSDRTKELSTKAALLAGPHDDPIVAAALVEGTVLADYSFDSHKSKGKEESKGTGLPPPSISTR